MHKKILAVFILLFSVHETIGAYDVDTAGRPFENIYVATPRLQGPEIKRLQERLAELGFADIGAIDGFYGPMTAGEVYFVKAALGFAECYIPENDWRPEDYSVVDAALWDMIFDPENAPFLSGISRIRFFNDDPLIHEPANNPRVTGFKEMRLPFVEPDWVPSWGSGSGGKVQREYRYDSGANEISVTETVETVFVVTTTVREFTFRNGLRIRQSIRSADDPVTEIKFSIP